MFLVWVVVSIYNVAAVEAQIARTILSIDNTTISSLDSILEFTLNKFDGLRIPDLSFLNLCFECENSTDACQEGGYMIKADRINIQELVGFELLYETILVLVVNILFGLFLQMIENSRLNGQKMYVAICVSFKFRFR